MLKRYESKYCEGRQSYKKIFEGNQRYVQKHLKAKGQTPSYLIIGCSDSRVPPNDLTQTEPGEIMFTSISLEVFQTCGQAIQIKCEGIGCVVQLETGLVDEIEVDEFMPEDLKAFQFQFKE